MSSSHSAGSLNLSDHWLLFNDNRTASRCLFARSRDRLFDVSLLRCNLIDGSMGGLRTPKFVGWREGSRSRQNSANLQKPIRLAKGTSTSFSESIVLCTLPLGRAKVRGASLAGSHMVSINKELEAAKAAKAAIKALGSVPN
jgi:hypothetical protein